LLGVGGLVVYRIPSPIVSIVPEVSFGSVLPARCNKVFLGPERFGAVRDVRIVVPI
jgi:hypothetical protein